MKTETTVDRTYAEIMKDAEARKNSELNDAPARPAFMLAQESAAVDFTDTLKWATRDLEPSRIAHLFAQCFEHVIPGGRQRAMPAAILRGLGAREELKAAEGGNLSADEARRLLGNVSKTTILEHHKKGLLLGWREKQNSVRFPVWQFTPEGPLPGLSDVLSVFNNHPGLDDWAKVLFFLQPLQSLSGRRPLDLLREGKAGDVAALAEAYVA